MVPIAQTAARWLPAGHPVVFKAVRQTSLALIKALRSSTILNCSGFASVGANCSNNRPVVFNAVRQTSLAHIKALHSSTNLNCSGFASVGANCSNCRPVVARWSPGGLQGGAPNLFGAYKGAAQQHHLEIAAVFKLTMGKNPAKVPVVGVF
ncbi:MAG: hypothetical protein PHT64_00755 [Bacteroidales bacterium]|nr:hypothetical protein [Bacteroidales bacterium]MDD4436202.1 hypothetical protein [Bacteroidales bacterium]MDD5732309.1 hypothetical protein [Bacteroidales bacterium]